MTDYIMDHPLKCAVGMVFVVALLVAAMAASVGQYKKDHPCIEWSEQCFISSRGVVGSVIGFSSSGNMIYGVTGGGGGRTYVKCDMVDQIPYYVEREKVCAARR